MHIPNELVLAILKYLERSHLKSARLVCKTWSSCASQFLFDQIYVAPNKIDLEVFSEITQHPSLKNCVRRLVYDASVFLSHLTRKEYVWDLSKQMRDLIWQAGGIPKSIDPQTFNDWMYDCSLIGGGDEGLPKLVAKWEDQSVFNRGYETYQEHSVYQQRTLHRGDFLKTLVLGLSRLDRLASVSLEGEWDLDVQRNIGGLRYGTHLARRWHPFLLRPSEWSWKSASSDGGDVLDGWRHYWIITTALFRAQRHIDEFAVGKGQLPGISPETFARKNRTQLNLLGLDIAALSGIKRLHLHMASCQHPSAPVCCDNIQGLGKLLESMRSLECLNLRLSENLSYDSVSLYSYNQVFPKANTWDQLQNLRLENFASSTTDLLRLFLIQMPSLDNIAIGDTQLLDGCWESVIECLGRFNQLTTFHINVGADLYDHGEEVFDLDYTDVEEYILHGGRHPCLPDDQPASASDAYMLQLDASLRDRLLELHRSRTRIRPTQQAQQHPPQLRTGRLHPCKEAARYPLLA